MASRERNRSFLKSIFDDDYIIEAMMKGECDQCILKAGHSILNKCGNCQYRFKCGVDMIEIVQERTDLLNILGFDGVGADKIFKMIDCVYQFMKDNVDEDKIYKLMYELEGMSGIDPLELVESLNEVFGRCENHNDLRIVHKLEEDEDE